MASACDSEGPVTVKNFARGEIGSFLAYAGKDGPLLVDFRGFALDKADPAAEANLARTTSL